MMITSPSDTLVLDTAKLQVWWQDADYDYGSELVPHQETFMEWVQMQIGHFLDSIFKTVFFQENSWWVWSVLGLIFILLAGLLIYLKHPGLFLRSGKKVGSLDYDITEDTIYGVDFSQEIEKAMERRDYREAVRLLYLHTLKLLSDNHQIEWQPFKTPTQYTYEWHHADFNQLSRLFVMVRYGGFEATEEMIGKVRSYQEGIRNNLVQTEEGGSHEE